MDRNSNSYTFLFAIIMVVVIASLLAYTATSLKPLQSKNVKNETMQNILASIGEEVDRDAAQGKFDEYVKKQISLKADGTVDPSVDAFGINMQNEIKKPVDEQRFPLYIAEKDGQTYYIVPLQGYGLWDAIWGYMSLKSDFNTINGVSFDHKGETAGLGAEITKDWFKDSFVNEKVFNENGDLVGITVLKGNNDPNNTDKDDHEVDAISGSTITGDGVTDMIIERLNNYLPYLKKLNIAQL